MAALIDDSLVEMVATAIGSHPTHTDDRGPDNTVVADCLSTSYDGQYEMLASIARAALAVAVPVIGERCAAAVADSVIDDPTETSAFARGLRTGAAISAGIVRNLTKVQS